MTSFLLALVSTSLSVTLLVGLVLLCCKPLLSRYRARSLYAVGVILFALLLVPGRPSLLPSVEVESTPALTTPVRIQASGPIETPTAVEERVPEPLSLESVNSPFQPSHSEEPPAWPIRWDEALFALWLLGALTGLTVRISRHAHFLHMARRWRTPLPQPHQRALKAACAELNMKPIPAWRVPLFTSPMAVGLVRPMLLLPEMGMAPLQLSLVLRHELHHVRRGDLWGKALIECAMAVHWFNPFLFSVRRGLSSLCEMACDETTLNGLGQDCRAPYLEIMLKTLAMGLYTPVSTQFDGGVKNMKLRIDRLLDMRPRKLGAGIMALALIFAPCTGNVLAASTPGGVSLDGRAPLSAFGSPDERMSEQDYLFVMGLKRPDMEQLSLEEWHAALKPDLIRLGDILYHHAAENRFMETLRCDIEDIIHLHGSRAEFQDAVFDFRSVPTGPAEFLSMSYWVGLHVPDPAAVTVGRRNAILDGIRSRMQEELVLQGLTDADNSQIWQAMRAFLPDLAAEYSGDGIEIRLTMRSRTAEADDPMGDYHQADFKELMSFAEPGYLQMSVEAFNRGLLPNWQRILTLLSGPHYSSHGFLATLSNSLFEIQQLPSAYWGFGSMALEFDCQLAVSWDIPDPGAVTVAERDSLLQRARKLFMLEYERIVGGDLPSDEMASRLEEACQRIFDELSGDGMTVSLKDLQLTKFER